MLHRSHARRELRQFRKLPIVVSASLMAVTGPGLAQSTDEDAAAAQRSPIIEEIVVTAQKRSESMQDIPIAVSAMTGESLEDVGIDSQSVLPQVTPNLQFNSSANYAAPYLRGVGTQFANPGLEPSVATYFDDQYLPRSSAGLLSFTDVERIEVLKGPQGTLYGRNATGGAIRVITRDPTEEFEAKAALSTGSFDQRGAEGVISGPIADGLLGRLAAQIDQNDGYVHNVDPSKPDTQARDQKLVRAKLIWNPGERTTVKFTADYAEKIDSEGQAFINLYPASPEQSATQLGGTASSGFYTQSGDVPLSESDDHLLNTKFGGATMRVDYDLDALTLSSITGYRIDKFHGVADLDSTDLSFLHATSTKIRSEIWSQEFQAVSAAASPLTWLGGVYIYHESSISGLGLFGDAIGPGAVAGGEGEVKVDSLAPYGQLSYDFSSEWQGTLGARYTVESKELVNNRLYTAPLSSNGVDPGERSYYYTTPGETVAFNEFSPKAVLSYRPSDGVMLYASYSKGFKSGGFNLPVPTGTSVDSVEPETLDSLEFGWKTDLGRMRLNGAVFYYDYKNLQVQTTDNEGGGITSVTNAATASIYGLEFDLTVAATDRLQLALGGGYLKAEFDSYDDGDIGVPAYTTDACADDPAACLGFAVEKGDLSGYDLPMAPDLTGYVRATYDVPTPSEWGHLVANVIYSYTSNFYYTADNQVEEPSKALLNAGVNWSSPSSRYEVGVFGQNLTDEEYNFTKNRFTATGGWRVPAPPRSWGLRVVYNY